MSVRILHVATRHRVGGAERNLLHTVSRQLERGFDVHVAVGTDDLVMDFPPRTWIHPIPNLVRDVSPTADLRAMKALRKTMRRHRFHVVHTHQSKAGAVGRSAARRLVPTIVHTVHMASFGPAYGVVQSAAFLELERRLTPITAKTVFVGAELQRRYLAARAVTRERCMVVHSPITNLGALISLRNAKAAHRARARAAIGAAAKRQLVLMVGALDRRKRHALAITSLAPLLSGGTIELLIAGQGPERGAIQDLCRDLGVTDSVRLLGYVRDVTPLYAAADVFLQASALEGVPQAVVQAVAAGVPVIATDVDGLREVVVGEPQVTILPGDGRGVLEMVRARLRAGQIPPAAPEVVDGWLPERVDEELDRLDDWMEARAGHHHPPRRTRSIASSPPESAVPAAEVVIR